MLHSYCAVLSGPEKEKESKDMWPVQFLLEVEICHPPHTHTRSRTMGSVSVLTPQPEISWVFTGSVGHWRGAEQRHNSSYLITASSVSPGGDWDQAARPRVWFCLHWWVHANDSSWQNGMHCFLFMEPFWLLCEDYVPAYLSVGCSLQHD